MTMLEIRKLTAGYRHQTVLREFSAGPFARGQLTAILGPNGSGKSTLLKALAGVLPPASGSIVLEARDITHLPAPERAHGLAYLPQALPHALHLRVLESVLVAGRIPGSSRTAPNAAGALETLDQLGIAPLAMHYLDQLSGGQKQLVGLAQALIRKPGVLLLDEPLTALDPNHQWQVMALLKRETRSRQLTTLIVLHDLNTALQHCEQAVLIRSGRCVRQGPPVKVITPSALAEVYDIEARMEVDTHGVPHVTVDGLRPPCAERQTLRQTVPL